MDTYNIQTRAQAKVEANNPTTPDTPLEKREQKATPEVTKLPIQLKKRTRNLKYHPAKLPCKPQGT